MLYPGIIRVSRWNEGLEWRRLSPAAKLYGSMANNWDWADTLNVTPGNYSAYELESFSEKSTLAHENGRRGVCSFGDRSPKGSGKSVPEV